MARQDLFFGDRRGLKGGKNGFRRANHGIEFGNTGMGKPMIDQALNQGFKGRPVIFNIYDHNGLIVMAELFPGDDFKRFIQGAQTTRQDNNPIG